MKHHQLPLIYSCSGCSSIAQLANQLALDLNRSGLAEMSCIAGVGGDVKPLVKKAKSGRPIIALDGCHLHCVKNTLARHQIEPSWHYTLTDFGVKKQYQTQFDPDDLDRVKTRVVRETGLEAD